MSNCYNVYMVKTTTTTLLEKNGLCRINDGDDVVKYYPHAGEELPDGPPSPVLMVRRVKDLYAQPWFNKNYCSQIGQCIDCRITWSAFFFQFMFLLPIFFLVVINFMYTFSVFTTIFF